MIMSLILWLFEYIPTFFMYVGIAVGLLLYFFAEVASIAKVSYLTSTLVRIVGVFLVVFSIFLLGVSISDKVFKTEIDKKNQEIAQIKKQAKEITKQVVTEYVYKDRIIKEKGDEIVKYITTKNDSDCSLHNSTIELLNSSAKNELPDPTRGIDETSSGVNLSTVTRTVTENYEKYHQVSNELTSLQDWVKKQQENNK